MLRPNEDDDYLLVTNRSGQNSVVDSLNDHCSKFRSHDLSP